MATTFYKGIGKKEKRWGESLVFLTNFYGGQEKGKCVQITIQHTAELDWLNEYICLDREGVTGLVNALSSWLYNDHYEEIEE